MKGDAMETETETEKAPRVTVLGPSYPDEKGGEVKLSKLLAVPL
jgi:hypothetical protein